MYKADRVKRVVQAGMYTEVEQQTRERDNRWTRQKVGRHEIMRNHSEILWLSGLFLCGAITSINILGGRSGCCVHGAGCCAWSSPESNEAIGRWLVHCDLNLQCHAQPSDEARRCNRLFHCRFPRKDLPIHNACKKYKCAS